MYARAWFKHVARQNKRNKDNTAQWPTEPGQVTFACFACCEKKVRARSSENLWVFDLRVLQVYSSASPLRLGPQRVGLAFASDAASGCNPEFSQPVLQRASPVLSGVPPCRTAWGAREQHKTANMVRHWTERCGNSAACSG